MLDLFYDARQSVHIPSFSRSSSKPELFVRHLREAGVTTVVRKVEPVTPEDLCSVHSSKYVRDVLELHLTTARLSMVYGKIGKHKKNPLQF